MLGTGSGGLRDGGLRRAARRGLQSSGADPGRAERVFAGLGPKRGANLRGNAESAGLGEQRWGGRAFLLLLSWLNVFEFVGIFFFIFKSLMS